MPSAKVEKRQADDGVLYVVRAVDKNTGSAQTITLRPPELSDTVKKGSQSLGGAWTVDIRGFGMSNNRHDNYKIVFTQTQAKLPR